jgi:hypothetical protein
MRAFLKSPFVQGAAAGILICFVVVIMLWALQWFVHLLPWPKF